MTFDWDGHKAFSNRRKHGVRFEEAAAIFDDVRAVTIQDPDHDEERFVTIGMDLLGRVLVVVYVWRGDTIRIISARKANRIERYQYAIQP